MRFLFYSSQLLNIHNYIDVFSRINHDFIITSLVPFYMKQNYTLYLSRFGKKDSSSNITIVPVFLRSTNESFLNLLNPRILIHDFMSILKTLHHFKPDVVISMYLLHAYPLIFFKKFFKFDLFTLAVGGDIYDKKGKFHRLVRYIIYGQSKIVFSVGYELKGLIEKEGGRNIMVIPTGVDPSFFKPLNSKAYLLSKWNFQKEFIILTLCQLIKRKAIDDLIRAVHLLIKNTHFPIKLIIAGDGPERQFLEKLVFELDMQDQVRFLGFVNEREKLELLNLADVYVLPSLNEGLPFSLLEAMSCGCICIATSVGDITKVIEHEQNGFIISPRNYPDLSDTINKIMTLPNDNLEIIRDRARSTIISKYDFVQLTKKMINMIVNSETRASKGCLRNDPNSPKRK